MFLEMLGVEGARRLLQMLAGGMLRDPARDAAIAIDAAVGHEGAGLFRFLQPAHGQHVGCIEGFGERLHRAAAALAEIGAERPIAEDRGATPGRKRPAGCGDRFVFQAAAADRAVEAAVGLQHDAGASFARDGTGGTNDAQEPGFAVPLDRFANAGPDLGHRPPSRAG